MSQDLRIGWAGSILLHLLLLLIALLSYLPEIVRNTDFVELQWGTIASEPTPEVRHQESTAPPVAQPARATPTPVRTEPERAQPARAERTVELPERRMPDLTDEVLAVPQRGDKLEAASGAALQGIPDRSQQERTQEPLALRPGGTAPGEKALPSASGAGEGTQGPGTGTVGSDVGYSVQWVGGGLRKRVSGRLPDYPEGTNVRAQVLIRAIVAPDGSVLSVTPVQKANRQLEEAAMSELRIWRFEPLRSHVPQVNQDCMVTFLFTVR